MHITVNVHCETAAEAEAVCACLGRMPSAELPLIPRPMEPGDDDEPVLTPVSPPKGRDAPPPSRPSRPMTGGELLAWIGDQADARAALRRVQDAGKRLGYGWQIRMWKPEAVAQVFGQLGGAS